MVEHASFQLPESSGLSEAAAESSSLNLASLAGQDGVASVAANRAKSVELNGQLTAQGFPDISTGPDPGASEGGGGGASTDSTPVTHHTEGTGESLANGSLATSFRSLGDGFRAAGDLYSSPFVGAWDNIAGFVDSEQKGFHDFSKGDVIGGIGYTVGAPVIGMVDGFKGAGHQLVDFGKNEWHSLQNTFNSTTHCYKTVGDVARVDYDIAATPVAGAIDAVTGSVGSEVKAVEDIAHGDVLGGIGHIVGAPVEGAIQSGKGVAHQLEDAGKNVWHGIENFF